MTPQIISANVVASIDGKPFVARFIPITKLKKAKDITND